MESPMVNPQSVKDGRLAALSTAHRDVQSKVQAAISAFQPPIDDSSILKTAFHSKIWPSLQPDYERFVHEVVRYCRDELVDRKFNCFVLGRAKTPKSVKESLDRREIPENPYTGLEDIFETMHDLAGSIIIMQYGTDVEKVNQFISQSFRAIKEANHWSRDREPGQFWKSRFGNYESHNHHVTLNDNYEHPVIIFEIQITTCSNFIYNKLAHDWYYKKANGSLSRKDEMVMDMLHGAAVVFEIGGEYMKEREKENRGQIENDYDLFQVMQLAQGTEKWQLARVSHRPLLEALRNSGYDTAAKLERFAHKIPIGCFGEHHVSNQDLVAWLLEMISQESKRHFVVPFGQNEDFVGRESNLEQLLRLIPPSTQKNNCQRTVIEGLGGIGKTQIALEAAYRVYERYSDCSVFWVPAMDIVSFENAYRQIGEALDAPGLDDEKSDIKSLVQTALNESAGSWLLVVDNADDIELVSALSVYFPSSRKGSILLTTRNHDIVSRLAIIPGRVENIGAMSRDEAFEMLKKNITESQCQDTASTSELLDLFADLPLAIRQASAYMFQNGISTKQYLGYCRSSNKTMMKLLSRDFEDRGRYKDIHNPIATTWLISFEYILRDKLLAAKYLKFICYLAEKDIPISLLPPGEDELEKEEAIGTLKGYAFIQERENQDSFDIHRLVRLAMRNWLEIQGEEREVVTYTIQHLSRKFPFPEHDNKGIWMGYLPHTQITLKYRHECTDKEALWHLLFNVGQSNNRLGKYAEAEQLYRQTLELREDVLGREHPSTLGSMNNLAIVLKRQGKYAEAEQIYRRQILKLMEEVLSREKPDKSATADILATMNNLANLLGSQGKYVEAEQIHRKTLELKEKVLGREHPYTLISRNNVAEVFRKRGKYAEAERMQRQTLELREKVLGRKHPFTLGSISSLALILDSQGKYTEAEQTQRQILKLENEVLGQEHPDTLGSMNNLAIILGNQGKYAEAEQMQRQTLELREKLLGQEHPSTLASINNLAFILKNQKNYEDAERTYRQALQLFENVLGPEHPDTKRCKNNLHVCREAAREGETSGVSGVVHETAGLFTRKRKHDSLLD